MKLSKQHVAAWPEKQRAQVRRKCSDIGWGYDCRGYVLHSGWAKDASDALARCADYPSGLGDVVASFTRLLRLDRIVHRFWPRCGCEKRRQWLNKRFPL
jgi:hypothetical protein